MTNLSQNKTCMKNCKKKDCLDFIRKSNCSGEYTCSKSFNNFLFVCNDGDKFLLNGLILDDKKNHVNAINVYRRGHRVTKLEIEKELEKVEALESFLQSSASDLGPRMSILHDIKTTFGIILSQVEKLIDLKEGTSFEEKLLNCEKELIDTYDALDLANSQLGMIDVLVNPGKINYGLKRKMNLFQLFERVSRLFRSKADKKGISINWYSESKVPDAYFHESIHFIPLVLLDNGIKYSHRDSAIRVYFNLNNDQLEIKCSSYGYFIPREEREQVFHQFKRGTNADKYVKQGIGIGLWIAKRIIEAHDGTISYSSEGFGNVGANNFILTLKLNLENK